MSDPSVPTQHSSTGSVPVAPPEGPAFVGNPPATESRPDSAAKRRRGSRGGRNRRKPGAGSGTDDARANDARANDARERVSGTDSGAKRVPQTQNAPENTPETTSREQEGQEGEQAREQEGQEGEGERAVTVSTSTTQPRARRRAPAGVALGELDRRPDDMPDPPWEGKPDVAEAAPEEPANQRPRIGDSRPAPPPDPTASGPTASGPTANVVPIPAARSRPSRRGRDRDRPGRSRPDGPEAAAAPAEAPITTAAVEQSRRLRPADRDDTATSADSTELPRRRRGKNIAGTPVVTEPRRGRERNGRPVGRYLMCVHVTESATQIAVLEGRSLIEHYVSRPTDNSTQIHGNIYMGRVQNVLPGMEAAFVDIATPKNAVIYRGDRKSVV